jgi:hypothetical protein
VRTPGDCLSVVRAARRLVRLRVRLAVVRGRLRWALLVQRALTHYIAWRWLAGAIEARLEADQPLGPEATRRRKAERGAMKRAGVKPPPNREVKRRRDWPMT